jgi:hypothetical protein
MSGIYKNIEEFVKIQKATKEIKEWRKRCGFKISTEKMKTIKSDPELKSGLKEK